MEERKQAADGRRQGKDRRQHTDPQYAGTERRVGSRRTGPRRQAPR